MSAAHRPYILNFGAETLQQRDYELERAFNNYLGNNNNNNNNNNSYLSCIFNQKKLLR